MRDTPVECGSDISRPSACSPTRTFDDDAAVAKTPFFFSTDITP